LINENKHFLTWSLSSVQDLFGAGDPEIRPFYADKLNVKKSKNLSPSEVDVDCHGGKSGNALNLDFYSQN
jgi:hypothetical protein